ncbi:hypothetical protein AB0C04_08630 [Micromonospora sp. NPDC048909]|uniref:hypothetical protein n=1 Tax=Micromonospora sp. NPDC048909 TaxID=3155643 RepID=UPI0033BFFD7A
MTFEEYAALARQLAEHRRAGERDAAAETERRRNLHATADSLHHRLTAQGQRLDQLGRAIGVSPPPPGPPTGAPPAPPPGPPGQPAGAQRADAEASAPPGPPTPEAVDAGAAAPPGSPAPDAADSGGAVAAPGRPVAGAYIPVAEETRLALPAAAGATAAGIPAPRAGTPDPAVELELARRYADEADRHGQQAELLAQRPTLLPTWSPLARAVAVYAGCGAAAGVLMLVLVLASGIGLVDGFTLGAWICAGLPALAFFAGYLVLGRWGRPAMVAGTPPRYLPLGFLLCFLLVPAAYCAYLLLFRALR